MEMVHWEKVLIMWLAGITGWFVVGRVALAYFDDEAGHLYQWVSRAPYIGLDFLCVMLWPVMIYFFRRGR